MHQLIGAFPNSPGFMHSNGLHTNKNYVIISFHFLHFVFSKFPWIDLYTWFYITKCINLQIGIGDEDPYLAGLDQSGGGLADGQYLMHL